MLVILTKSILPRDAMLAW